MQLATTVLALGVDDDDVVAVAYPRQHIFQGERGGELLGQPKIETLTLVVVDDDGNATEMRRPDGGQIAQGEKFIKTAAAANILRLAEKLAERLLRVKVNAQDTQSHVGESAGTVDGPGGLAHTALARNQRQRYCVGRIHGRPPSVETADGANRSRLSFS